MGKLEKGGIDKQFQEQVRDKLQPGTSALFIVFEKVTRGQGDRGAFEVRRRGRQDLALGRDHRRDPEGTARRSRFLKRPRSTHDLHEGG